MIIFLYGDDTEAIQKYAHESVAKFKRERDPEGYNVVTIDGAKVLPGTLWAEIGTTPFLAEKRLVVVRDLLANQNEDLLSECAERFKNDAVPKSTVVLVWQSAAVPKSAAAKELLQILQAQKYAREFPLLSGAQLARAIVESYTALGAEADREAVNAVAEATGGNGWERSALINQTAAYAKGRAVTSADVTLFAEPMATDNIFGMLEALMGKNQREAYRLLALQRQSGDNDHRIFTMVVWQVRRVLSVADFLARQPGATSADVAAALAMKPFAATKSVALANKFSLAELERLERALLTMDEQMKTSIAEPGTLLDILVSKV